MKNGKWRVVCRTELRSLLDDLLCGHSSAARYNLIYIIRYFEKEGDSFQMYWNYLKSLLTHKIYVYKIGRLLKVPLRLRILHDLSKFSLTEFVAYARFFNGNRTDYVKMRFDIAWQKHVNENKHHWQHWTVLEDDGSVLANDMPEIYIREMVADWVGANFAFGNETFWDWYKHSKVILSAFTEDWVVNFLSTLKNRVSEIMELTGQKDYLEKYAKPL